MLKDVTNETEQEERIIRTDESELEIARITNIEKLRLKKTKEKNSHNKNKEPIKDYETGQVVFVKQNKRIELKLNPRYR
ncbi:unnamed protein product [Hermetia illucens]|uniref:Uncharacterized protein n=1 Tax=Hermetia illucens TaxID=343691 RepID=A0A7R8UDQ5_HERIL|nr:unnamed protein product [Hermetia illucens]